MKTFEKKTIPIIATSVALFDFVMLYSMRSFWSGLHSAVNWAPFPYVLFGLVCAVLATSVVLLFVKLNKLYFYISGGFSALIMCLCIYMFFQIKDMWSTIALEILYALIFCVTVGVIVFFIFFYPKTKLKDSRLFKFLLVGILVAVFVLSLVSPLFYFTNGASVYAVNDEYQIVFTTNADSVGWVEVGNEKYYDSKSGVTQKNTTIHKVCIPMNVLDSAKFYTIKAQKSISTEPYDGWMGAAINRKYTFRPVDSTDGLNYFSVSDNHNQKNAVIQAIDQAEKKANGKLDFLVINGDVSSYLKRLSDFTVLQVASQATQGQYPIIYARGNHETKGEMAGLLADAVGCDDGKFYYTVKLDDVWAIVLDMGEDHNDDWWEYYGTADFTSYRLEQYEFIKSVIANKENEYAQSGVNYRLAICHTPIASLTRGEITEGQKTTVQTSIPEIKQMWTEELNKIGLNLCLSGHRHQVMVYTTDIPYGTELKLKKQYTNTGDYTNYDSVRLDANFAQIVGSRRSLTQKINVSEDVFGGAFIGSYATFDGSQTVLSFLNNKGENVSYCDPWGTVNGEQQSIVIK